MFSLYSKFIPLINLSQNYLQVTTIQTRVHSNTTNRRHRTLNRVLPSSRLFCSQHDTLLFFA